MDAPTAVNVSSSSSVPSSTAAVPGDTRYRWLLASALVVLACTAIAFRQNPNPNPFAAPRWTDGDYWRYPVETNTYKRLPLLRGINAVAVAADSSPHVVAAVGQQLLYSEDAGVTWQKAKIDWRGPQPARAAAIDMPQVFAKAWAGEVQQQTSFEGDAKGNANAYANEPPQRQIEQKEIPPQKIPALNPAREPIKKKSSDAMRATDSEKSKPDERKKSAYIYGEAENIAAVTILGSGQGYAIGGSGAVLRSSDFGKTWKLRSAIPTGISISLDSMDRVAIAAVDDRHAWYTSLGESIYVTSDGGVTWKQLDLANNFWPKPAQFVDSQRGWMNTALGGLARSDDGGQSWRALFPAFDSEGFQFLDRDNGWVLARGGELLSTKDGGDSWNKITSPKFAKFRFLDARNGWGLTDKGVLHNTRDSGLTWKIWSQGETESGTRLFPALNELMPLGEDRVLIATHNNLRLAQRDAKQWLPLTRPEFGFVDNITGLGACQSTGLGELMCSSDYRQWQLYPLTAGDGVSAFKFVDARTGWIGTREGRLLMTRDAGRKWEPIREAPTGVVKAIDFADAFRGWLVSSSGVYRTNDAGETWQPQRGLCGDCYQRVKFNNTNIGWFLGEHALTRTVDGGQSWQSTPLPETNSAWRGAIFIDADVGWLVGDNGAIFASTDSGVNWKPQKSAIASALNDIIFLDPKTGWAVGDNGVLLGTNNGGASWKKLKTHSVDMLRSINFHDSNNGVIFGAGGPALYTEDGGKNWQRVVYRREPARWYYLGLGAAFALLLPALRRPDPERRVAESIANLLASDAPLQPGDPDPLSFGVIARTLSAFIRNRNTTPPLTIAVCGRWGSGKSSLMNLLRSDLKRYGFPGVWFNAWHHQKEEHLLASLLAAIRTQGVPKLLQARPPFINPDWVSFRYGLLVQRGPNYWLTALFFLFIAALSAAFVADNPSTVDQRLAELLRLLPWIDQPDRPGAAAAAAETQPWQVLWNSRDLFGLATSLSLVAAGIFKVLRAFGVSPGKLLEEATPNRGSKDLDSRLDFRHYFGKEFREVTAALHPQRMVIFIDDLDRCRHEHVLEVLEAINFLVSSGDCIVVLGMDYQVVQQSVILEYADLAKQLATGAHGDDMRAERFAEEYLEKLINVQVAVPTLEPGESAHLLVPEPQQPTPWQIYCEQIRGVARVLSPVLLVIAAVLLGVIGGQVLVDNVLPQPIIAVSNVPAVVATPSSTPTAPTSSPDETETATAPQKITTKALFASEAQILPRWDTYVVLPIVVLRRRDVITDDSDTFREALQIWSGVVQLHRNTPRAVKRYLNRARYLAMRLRQQRGEDPSGWRNLLQRRKKEIPTLMLDEQCLVAISALHHVDPAWLHPDTAGDRLPEEVIEAIAKHRATFGVWPPPPIQLEQFQWLVRGIRV